jgi:hypothetical protein
VVKELIKIGVVLKEGSISNFTKAIYLLDASQATAMSPASLNSIL